ncbi:hypothetical protein TSUD_348180 [Trifolium subterraneum]|nr:hypothetical protein TSUD_348180 [Trifolium subterraneum]
MAPSTTDESSKQQIQDKHLKPQQQQDDDEEALQFASQLTGSIVVPLALRSAIDLGIFDILAKAGEGAQLSAQDIAVKIGTNNPQAPTMLDRLLRLLASHSILNSSVPQHPQSLQIFYSLSNHSKYFVTDADGISLGPTLALLLDNVFYQSWSELKGAIVEGGIPFNRVYGMHAFEYPRVEHVGGDMFESVPAGDAIFMKWILHDWSDEHCLKLLKNCYKAIPEDGKVIVVDSILPSMPETTGRAKFGFASDLLMMTQNPGGKERTEQEFIELAKGSGFSGIKPICCVSGLWVIEFFK